MSCIHLGYVNTTPYGCAQWARWTRGSTRVAKEGSFACGMLGIKYEVFFLMSVGEATLAWYDARLAFISFRIARFRQHVGLRVIWVPAVAVYTRYGRGGTSRARWESWSVRLAHLAVGSNRDYGLVIVKEQKTRVGNGDKHRRGILFAIPHRMFHLVGLLGYRKVSEISPLWWQIWKCWANNLANWEARICKATRVRFMYIHLVHYYNISTAVTNRD